MLTLKCRACKGPRHASHYLCRDCWGSLPRAARTALTQRGPQALARLRSLHDQIDEGLPLSAICIPTTPEEN